MLHTGQNDNDNDIIKIDLSIFKKHYLSFNKKLIPDSLLKKRQEIYNNHNCFHVSFDKDNYNQGQKHNNNSKSYNYTASTHNNNTYNHYHAAHITPRVLPNSPHQGTKNQNRLYIITSDFTEDTKIKKQFMSYLNKLTENNKTSIYPKIQELIATISDTTLNEATYATVWDFIKKSPSDIYVYLLQFFDEAMTSKYIEKYMHDKLWYPPEYAFENNLLTADEALYDMYCDYVKWKNYVSNNIKVICTLEPMNSDKQMVDKLLNDLYDLFFDNLYQSTTKHIVNFALEQIHNIMKIRNNVGAVKNKDIKYKLRGIDTNELESSSKFLIMDILAH